jgi:hypothetical protein
MGQEIMGIQEELARAKKKLEKVWKGDWENRPSVSDLFKIRMCLAEVKRLEEEIRERIKGK